jgi:hypothetical protein
MKRLRSKDMSGPANPAVRDRDEEQSGIDEGQEDFAEEQLDFDKDQQDFGEEQPGFDEEQLDFDVSKPHHFGRDSGFTIIHGDSLRLGPDHQLSSRTIFLCSEDIAKKIIAKLRIKIENIVQLNIKSDKKNEDLPDVPLKISPQKALKFFHDRLETISLDKLRARPAEKDIIIHCHAGMCRTPTAALIYLVKCGMEFLNAKNVVCSAMRRRTTTFSKDRFESKDYNFLQVIGLIKPPELLTERELRARERDSRIAATSSSPAPSPMAISSSSSLPPLPSISPMGPPPLPSISSFGSPPLPVISRDLSPVRARVPRDSGRGMVSDSREGKDKQKLEREDKRELERKDKREPERKDKRELEREDKRELELERERKDKRERELELERKDKREREREERYRQGASTPTQRFADVHRSSAPSIGPSSVSSSSPIQASPRPTQGPGTAVALPQQQRVTRSTTASGVQQNQSSSGGAQSEDPGARPGGTGSTPRPF